ncbi:MAG: hypothetical protein M1812_002800 [Candelaria pacifica]|nr:MAG: hypothetical protein M1812_002800 [Candelaria pacifica]
MLPVASLKVLLPLIFASFTISATIARPNDVRQSFTRDSEPDLGISNSQSKERRQAFAFASSSTYGIHGVATGRGEGGSLPFRQEVLDLQLNNPDQWNLYMLALDRLQSVDQSEKLSWYQIGGIHGRPFVAWDGVSSASNGSSSYQGYCTHNSILFPTWHRPYVALFEQVLWNTMQNISNEFPSGPDHDRYTAAAADFRVPYWDWAKAPPTDWGTLPWSVGGPTTVDVVTPTGNKTINNPLYTYKFHELKSNDFPDTPFATWNNTLRYPNSQSPDASSQDLSMGSNLDNSRLALRDRVYNLLVNNHNYRNFSNKSWYSNGSPSNPYDSLESIHDTVHGIVGHGGHMGFLEYAGFDPVFMLHHAMLDRVFALWQAVNDPGEFVEPATAKDGTYTTATGATEDINTPLTPFHSDDTGDWWISDSVRSIKTFGYSYKELADWNYTSTNDFQASVRGYINTLYGNTSPSKAGSKRKFKRGLTSDLQTREKATDAAAAEISVVASDGKYNEYLANIRVPKDTVGGSFFVYIFLGDFNPDPTTWITEPNLVGTHFVFTSITPIEGQNIDVSGVIPLTTALLDDIQAGCLKSLDTAEVEPYLKANLHWRVTKVRERV